MNHAKRWTTTGLPLNRRRFLQAGAFGAAALPFWPQIASSAEPASPTLESLLRELQYLTPESEFGNVERGKPVPSSLPPEKLKTVGLTRESPPSAFQTGRQRPRLGRPDAARRKPRRAISQNHDVQ